MLAGMDVSTLSGAMLKRIILKAAEALDKNKSLIDALNVFPVPDGDTGANMSLTMMSAAREADAVPDNSGIGEVARAASFGALKGARGNSGVILSQLLRGFAKELEGINNATTENIACAFIRAGETAYKAVMKPKEGTILTVAREIGLRALDLSFETDDFQVFMTGVLEHGNMILKKTKDMLPVLKQADVVDAGGQGLICLLTGALACLSGEEVSGISFEEPVKNVSGVDFSNLASAEGDIAFTYCTEFFVNYESSAKADGYEAEIKAYLDSVGDSVAVVSDEGMMKVHVHSNSPGAILEKALEYGFLSNIKIDNMKLQHNEKISFIESGDNTSAILSSTAATETKQFGFVAVSSGKGFDEIFMNLNSDALVAGGQTMNPSTGDIISAVDSVDAREVFILPNNKNIILAAEQAAEMSNGKKIHVVPTKTMPQGINAMLNFIAEDTAEANIERMINSRGEVKTGMITTAVRKASMNGFNIRKGDTLCMLDDDIVAVAKTRDEGVKILADKMLPQGDYFGIYYGEDVTEAEANAIAAYAMEKSPDSEIEIYNGGQPVYSYLLSVI